MRKHYNFFWGKGYCGAVGHGDEIDKITPELLSRVQSQPACRADLQRKFVHVIALGKFDGDEGLLEMVEVEVGGDGAAEVEAAGVEVGDGC
ncbi:hypothetical protein ACLB2K_010917 [Fragaria x ananassa]